MAITAALDIKGYSAKPYQGKDMETTVPYFVYTDTYDQTETDIMTAAVLPNRGDVHPQNIYLAAFEGTLKRNDALPTLWHATITYKTDSMDKRDSDRQLFPNPTLRPADIEWSTVAYTVPADKSVEDYTPPGETQVVKAGSPIVNSAWDRFETPIEKTDFNWIVTVTKLVPAVPTYVLAIPGTVNTSPFSIDGAYVQTGCARIVGLNIGRFQRENGFNYREFKITLETRRTRNSRFVGEVVPPPFILEIEDAGYNERPSLFDSTYQSRGLGDLKPIVDKTGKPITSPVNLGNNGQEKKPLTFENAAYRCYKIYRTSNFNQLPLS